MLSLAPSIKKLLQSSSYFFMTFVKACQQTKLILRFVDLVNELIAVLRVHSHEIGIVVSISSLVINLLSLNIVLRIDLLYV